MGLTFFMVDDVWVNEFLKKLRTKEIRVRVLYDLTANQAVPGDPYLKFAREAKLQGGQLIDDPDRTAIMAHKAKFHKLLLENCRRSAIMGHF